MNETEVSVVAISVFQVTDVLAYKVQNSRLTCRLPCYFPSAICDNASASTAEHHRTDVYRLNQKYIWQLILATEVPLMCVLTFVHEKIINQRMSLIVLIHLEIVFLYVVGNRVVLI